MASFEALRAMSDFEQIRIMRIVPILERIQNEIKEKSSKSIYLRNDDGKYRSLRYLLNAKGVDVIFWDTHTPHDGCLHIERGLEPSVFVKRYVTTVEDAGKIANALNVSLG